MAKAGNLPIIDLHDLERDPAVLDMLRDACQNWGFFQAVGHEIDQNVLEDLHTQMRALFALPPTAKQAIRRTSENPWGFFDEELTKNKRDRKEIFDVGPDARPGDLTMARAQWPAELPDFRIAVETFYAACESLSFRLLAGIVRSLGTPQETALHGNFAPHHTSFLRLNYYPRLPDGATAAEVSQQFGVHEHTDSGALTVLLQDDQPGLQVLRNGVWTVVEPRSDALVINIGDIVQVWSNDRYQAAIHRVQANPTADRYSVPFFFNPASDVYYAPLESTCTASTPARYRPINWGAFRAARAAGDYADLGEEIQIAQFRTPGS